MRACLVLLLAATRWLTACGMENSSSFTVTAPRSSGAGSPDGDLRLGTPGNGEWVSRADDPANTAPVGGSIFGDGFESGNISAW